MKKTIFITLFLPTVTWAQSFGWFKQFKNDGGITAMYNHDVSVNHNNEIVSCGLIESSLGSGVGEDFDPGSSTHDVFPTGVMSYNIWVSKLDSNGNYMWLSNFPVNNDGTGKVFAKQNNSGEVFVAGRFNQTADFDPGAGTYTMSPTVSDNGFYAKLNSNGTFAWAKQLTGITGQFTDIEADSQGNLLLIGNNSNTGFYIAKVSGSTGNMIWMKKINSSYVTLNAMTLDNTPKILILGVIAGNVAADVDPSTTGTYTISGTGLFSASPFVLKLDTAGNFIWAKVFNDYSSSSGANGSNPVSDIQTDNLNNVYVSGQSRILIDFDPSPSSVDTIRPKNNSTDIYVVSLDANGNHNWAKQYGGSGNDYTTRLLIGSNNDVFIATEMPTSSYDIDFDPGAATYTVPYSNFGANTNMALNHLTSTGNFVAASFFVSNYSNDNDNMNGLALTSGGNVIATGEYNCGNGGNYWVDFDPGAGTVNEYGGNIFILKLLNGTNGTITGIKTNEPLISNLLIYPNPVKDLLYIKDEFGTINGNIQLSIINVFGQEILPPLLYNQNEINVSSLPAGTYFVKMEGRHGVNYGKFIKD